MKRYTTGFIISIVLTLTAYFIVTNNLFSGWNLILAVMGLALIQVWVQLVFFLHLGVKENSRANLAVFASTVGVILILVVGSLWIMKNLNYHMMPTDSEIIESEGLHR